MQALNSASKGTLANVEKEKKILNTQTRELHHPHLQLVHHPRSRDPCSEPVNHQHQPRHRPDSEQVHHRPGIQIPTRAVSYSKVVGLLVPDITSIA